MNKKIKLFGSTVLRKDSIGKLFLMNHQEKGWSSNGIQISSLADLQNRFDVVLGRWLHDECSEYIEVIPAEDYLKLPTFEEFMASEEIHNSYIEHPDFIYLYVRKYGRFFNKDFRSTIDIANVKSICPGNGAFTRLVQFIRATYPTYKICVENAFSAERFGSKLQRLGFTRRNYSYYLEPGQKLLT